MNINKLNTTFCARQAKPSEINQFKGDTFIDFSDDAIRILGSERLSWIQILPYLYRRFGFSYYGYDDYKDICRYIITTPNPDVCLSISPGSCTVVSFGYLTSPEMSEKLNNEVYLPKRKWYSEFSEWCEKTKNFKRYNRFDYNVSVLQEEFSAWTESIGFTDAVFDNEVASADLRKLAKLPQKEGWTNEFLNEFIPKKIKSDNKQLSEDEVIAIVGENEFKNLLVEYAKFHITEKYLNQFWKVKEAQEKLYRNEYELINPFPEIYLNNKDYIGNIGKFFKKIRHKLRNYRNKKMARPFVLISDKIYFYFEEKAEKKRISDIWWERLPDGNAHKDCYLALTASIVDLLRPVRVRDVAMNITGILSEKEYSRFYEENEDGEYVWEYLAYYSDTAGYGIPIDFCENIDCLCKIRDFIKKEGNGCFKTGLQNLDIIEKKCN